MSCLFTPIHDRFTIKCDISQWFVRPDAPTKETNSTGRTLSRTGGRENSGEGARYISAEPSLIIIVIRSPCWPSKDLDRAFPPFVGTTFLPLIQIALSHCPRWIRGHTLATESRCIGLTFINNNTKFDPPRRSSCSRLGRETRLFHYRCRRTPRNLKTYISGGHIRRTFINNNNQSSRRSQFPPFVDSTLLPLILIGQRRGSWTYIY